MADEVLITHIEYIRDSIDEIKARMDGHREEHKELDKSLGRTQNSVNRIKGYIAGCTTIAVLYTIKLLWL